MPLSTKPKRPTRRGKTPLKIRATATNTITARLSPQEHDKLRQLSSQWMESLDKLADRDILDRCKYSSRPGTAIGPWLSYEISISPDTPKPPKLKSQPPSKRTHKAPHRPKTLSEPTKSVCIRLASGNDKIKAKLLRISGNDCSGWIRELIKSRWR